MKVMIADDEGKICQLIQCLVDWKALDMEVVAVAHNGLEALELIKEHKPDIAITDIRMPGCNGLSMIKQARKIVPDMEYIIISGYRDFEYAHKAIQFGVSDYLLKPIDKNELILTLEKMRTAYLEKTEQLTKEEKLRKFEKSDKQRMRKLVFKEVMMQQKKASRLISIQDLNETYKYHFKEGIFQTVMIKIDGARNEIKTSEIYLEDKIRQILLSNLKDCYDWECSFADSCCLVVLNYPMAYKGIRKNMRKVLEELLLQQNVLKGIRITIGMGVELDFSGMLKERMKSAKWAVAQRLMKGSNQVILGEIRNANEFADSDLFKKFNKEFSIAIELQDLEEVKKTLRFLEMEIRKLSNITGYEVLQMTKEAMNVYIFALFNNQLPTEGINGLFDEFNKQVHDCGTMKELFAYLLGTITKSFEKILEEKDQMDTKPIKEAKKYILQHYKEPISLEIVSEVVGFNTTYFSTMFKKETGINFSEYLLNLRLDKAKELLKETKKSIADICEEVGYHDVKYFTKKFTNYTSLKPNEYRKLYS